METGIRMGDLVSRLRGGDVFTGQYSYSLQLEGLVCPSPLHKKRLVEVLKHGDLEEALKKTGVVKSFDRCQGRGYIRPDGKSVEIAFVAAELYEVCLFSLESCLR